MPQPGRRPAGAHGAARPQRPRAGVWTIVVAAGAGVRFGAQKQYERLGSHRVLDWALASARAVSDGVVLVVPPERAGDREHGVDATVAGGATRSESVRAGLAVVPPGTGVIVVHDAARPLAPPSLFEAVVAALDGGADGAVPGLPIADTVKRVHDHRVVTTLDRAELVTVQTPQAFQAALLRRAHGGGGEATDDAALVEQAGGTVVIVDGDPLNIKITNADDLARAREHVDLRTDDQVDPVIW